MEKKNLAQKLKRTGAGILAGLTMASAVGCTSLPEISSRNYQSPVIRSEYGFKVNGRRGYVDETNPVYIEDGNLYVVGFSKAYSNEVDAIDDATRNATLRFAELAEVESVRRLLPISYESISVKSEDGQQGHIVETLTEIPLSALNSEVQQRIKQRVGAD